MRYANELIIEELQRDREFLKAHLASAIACLFQNDASTACSMLRDIVNATIGFPSLAERLGKKDKGKGLMQMLTRTSNPTVNNLFLIISEVMLYERLAFSGAEIEDKAA